jgi:hypothetical protein
MTYQPNIINFTVSFSPDDEGYIVHEVSNAFSFARVPAANQYFFGRDKATAHEQVRRLHAWQRKGNAVDLRDIETPERFEAVADTKYGCEW